MTAPVITAEPIVRSRGLAAGYNGTPVVRDIDFEVRPGEILALLGRNGAGKTTILHTLAGLIPVVGGDLTIAGLSGREPVHVRTRWGVALVTEERAIIRRLTVAENLRLGVGSAQRAYDIFPELLEVKNRRAGLLSGGQQQMLALGRSLAAEPKLLLIDEMSFGLAPLIVSRLGEAVRQAARSGVAVVLVEQHPRVALQIADHGCVISGGRLAVSGRATDLLSNLAEIEKSYLSSATVITKTAVAESIGQQT